MTMAISSQRIERPGTGSGPAGRRTLTGDSADAVNRSNDAEQLLLRWQRQGDRNALDQLAGLLTPDAQRLSREHHGRLKSSSFDTDDVSQEALRRFVREAERSRPDNVRGLMRTLVDRSAKDMNRRACHAKRGGRKTVLASVYWADDGDYLKAKAYSSDSPVELLGAREGIHRGICFDESDVVYIPRVFEPDSRHAREAAARARRLAKPLSRNIETLAKKLGRSRRTVERQKAKSRSQLESRFRLLRAAYRSAGKDGDVPAVTELVQKLDRVTTVRARHRSRAGR
jgi:hypothetical protein